MKLLTRILSGAGAPDGGQRLRRGNIRTPEKVAENKAAPHPVGGAEGGRGADEQKKMGLTAQAVCLDIYRFSPFTMSAMLAIWLSVSDFISSASAPAAVGLWLSASKNSCGEMPK